VIVDYLCNAFTPDRLAAWDQAIEAQGVPLKIRRDESVLRFMATKLDKYAVEYNARKRSGVPTGTEKLEA